MYFGQFQSNATTSIVTTRSAGPPPGTDLAALLRSRRHARQQRMTIVLLLVAIVGLAIAGLMLAIGPSQSAPDKPAATGTKKTPSVRPEIETPEALEAREGIESLDPAKPKWRRPSVAEPTKMPHKPQPGTPEGHEPTE